jgi:hypothetical protein
MSVLLQNDVSFELRNDVSLDLREADLNRREAASRRQIFDASAQFAERERELTAERDRLLRTIQELHHRLRRAEMIGITR